MSDATSTSERPGAGMTAQEIAKAIRADLKAAVKAGELPKAQYFVRQTWSGYTPSIRVAIKGWAGQLFNEGWIEHVALHNECPRHIDRNTEAAQAVIRAVEQIASRLNWDESRPEEDYYHRNYYLHVEFDHEWSKARREEESKAWGVTREAA